MNRFERRRLIGTGGFGVVWECFDTLLKRSVAVKFLKPTMTAEVARFQREARLAAALSHPNIVAIHDVGESGGEHFIVMDLIDGVPAGRAKLDPRDAARVMRDVADALQHAHSRGVIHRDLKPDNILVCEGRPYVTDFGLAKSMRDVSSLSVSGEVMGTPSFMAPEQARGDLDQLGPTTDVYAIGSTLYALLADRAPFEDRSVYRVLQAVIEQEPAPVPGDFDLRTLVGKCMEKDAMRRYPTAGAARDDLDRYLAGEPILARPATWTYRMGKRIARNRAFWVLAAGLAGAVVLGTVFSVHSLLKAKRAAEERVAALERNSLVDRAASDLAKAQRDFDEADLDAGAWRTQVLRIRESLEQGLQRFPHDAQLLYHLGVTCDLLGLKDAAERSYTQAIERDPNDPRPLFARAKLTLYLLLIRALQRAPETPGSKAALAGARQDMGRAAALGWDDPGEIEGAEAILALLSRDLDRLDAICRASIEAGGRTQHFHYLRGFLRMEQGRYAEAIPDLDAALRQSPHLAMALHARAAARALTGDFRGAVADCDHAIQFSPGFVAAIHNRGMARHALGDHVGELADFKGALELDPLAADVHVSLGNCRFDRGDAAGAIEAYNQALRIKPEFADALFNRGQSRYAAGEPEAALADYEAALRIDARHYPARHGRAVLHEKAGRFDAAIEDLTEAIGIRPGDPAAWVSRARVRGQQGDIPGAFEDSDHAVALAPRNPDARLVRGVAREKLGQWAAAAADYRGALEVAPPEWPDREMTEGNLRVAEEHLRQNPGDDF